MYFHIKQAETEEEFKRYYQLRWKLLRAPWNQPAGSEVDDIEDQCFHLIASSDKNKVIGVARLQFNSDSEAQIRYMAVAETHERQGIGRGLVTTLEAHAAACDRNRVILHAREPAVGFYEKLGYKITRKSYLLFNEIQHFHMIKKL